MADIDLIASDDSPFDPWVREAAKAARNALKDILDILDDRVPYEGHPANAIAKAASRGLGEQ